MKTICDICGKEIEMKEQVVFRKYKSRPFYRYIIVDKFDVCNKCFNRMKEIIRRGK